MIVRLSEASARGLKRYFTGKPCVRGHVSERSVSGRSCIACNIADAERYRKTKPLQWKLVAQRYRSTNEKLVRQRTDTWRRKNLSRYAVYEATRRARKRSTSTELTQADQARISEIYAQRARISLASGVEHHVDHIVALRNGGAHHPDNLRIIPAIENQRKGCR